MAINSALQVDLSGQVCADSPPPPLGTSIYSGVGGQMDFVRVATSLSEGGRSVYCVTSPPPVAAKYRVLVQF